MSTLCYNDLTKALPVRLGFATGARRCTNAIVHTSYSAVQILIYVRVGDSTMYALFPCQPPAETESPAVPDTDGLTAPRDKRSAPARSMSYTEPPKEERAMSSRPRVHTDAVVTQGREACRKGDVHRFESRRRHVRRRRRARSIPFHQLMSVPVSDGYQRLERANNTDLSDRPPHSSREANHSCGQATTAHHLHRPADVRSIASSIFFVAEGRLPSTLDTAIVSNGRTCVVDNATAITGPLSEPSLRLRNIPAIVERLRVDVYEWQDATYKCPRSKHTTNTILSHTGFESVGPERCRRTQPTRYGGRDTR